MVVMDWFHCAQRDFAVGPHSSPACDLSHSSDWQDR
jgi:hypothetical protein